MREYLVDLDSLEEYLLTAKKFVVEDDAAWVEFYSQSFKGKTIWEFGVWKGDSTRVYAQQALNVVGLDSFHGLPVEWHDLDGNRVARVGTFTLYGNVPVFEENVKIVKGEYKRSLQPFLDTKPDSPDLIVIDCDVYCSAIFVLESLYDSGYLLGAEVCFDEIYGFRNATKNNELRALYDFLVNHPEMRIEPLVRGECLNGDSGKVSMVFFEKEG